MGELELLNLVKPLMALMLAVHPVPVTNPDLSTYEIRAKIVDAHYHRQFTYGHMKIRANGRTVETLYVTECRPIVGDVFAARKGDSKSKMTGKLQMLETVNGKYTECPVAVKEAALR